MKRIMIISNTDTGLRFDLSMAFNIDFLPNAFHDVTLPNCFAGQVVFDSFSPNCLMSEHLLPSGCFQIRKCILENKLDKYIGIIIPYRTENFALALAALAFILADLSIPVMIVPIRQQSYDWEHIFRQVLKSAVSFINSGT
ncbi:MAG: hypothetical protein AAGU32_06280, partial [Bacillota bacterium]